MLAIIDYGVGNLFSLCGALAHMGIENTVTSDPADLEKAERIILPGVGAFGDSINQFRAHGLQDTLDRQVRLGKPLLGICVGMQLLFEKSYEFGTHEGLGYLNGSIDSLSDDIPAHYKVPHIGWNSLQFCKPDDPLLKYLRAGEYVYYVHSFYAKGCESSVVAGSDYSVFVPGIVRAGNVCGTQFHPEKSGETGQRLLKAFCEL